MDVDQIHLQANQWTEPKRDRPYPVFTSTGFTPMLGSQAADIVLLFYGLRLTYFDTLTHVSIAQSKMQCLVAAAEDLHQLIVNLIQQNGWITTPNQLSSPSPRQFAPCIVHPELIDFLVMQIGPERWFDIWGKRKGTYGYKLTNGDMIEYHADGWNASSFDDLNACRAWVEYAVTHALTARMLQKNKLRNLTSIVGWYIEDQRETFHFFKYSEKNRQV